MQEWRGKEEWWCNGAWEWFVRISVLFAIVIRRKKNCTREELTTRTNWAWISPFFSSHLVASYQSSAAAELCLATISAHSGLKSLILFMWTCGKCFTYVTKTRANLTTYSRKLENYNGTIIFEIDIMKNSSPLNLKFTIFAMSKPK